MFPNTFRSGPAHSGHTVRRGHRRTARPRGSRRSSCIGIRRSASAATRSVPPETGVSTRRECQGYRPRGRSGDRPRYGQPDGAEGRHSRGRPRHPLPSRHQSAAQGDAAARRQAGHPVRGRGGGPGRHHRHPDHHRPGQAQRSRTTSTGPSSSSSTWGRPGRKREAEMRASPSWPTCTTCGRPSRRVSVTRWRRSRPRG